MHQPRRCNEQAVLRNQIDKHKIFLSLTLCTNSKKVERCMLWALTRHHKQALQKRSKSKVVVHKKTFGLFAQPKKFHSRTMLFSRDARERKQIFKNSAFLHWPRQKGFVSRNLVPQLRKASFSNENVKSVFTSTVK